jgi:agmatinase
MKRYSKQFLDIRPEFSNFDSSAVAILPVPYEGGISFGKGAASGPKAVIDASCYLELYDEVFKTEPYRMGIVTIKPLASRKNAVSMQKSIYQSVLSLINKNKFVIGIGGDHSISIGFVKALTDKYSKIAVIQLDAHSDLRDTYEDNSLSHACVMSRIREYSNDTLQIGIRSMSVEESKKITKENLPVITMHDYRKPGFDLDIALSRVPDPVYLSVDVDVFDWSVIRSTGTPEPGGLGWDEAMTLLEKIFMLKTVIGFDLVELAAQPGDINSSFAAAKLIYKMLGFKLASEVNSGRMQWPDKPAGKIF